jgi:DNA-binding PadR family transcriptional regulator
LTAQWEAAKSGRRTRIYQLTPAGEKRLEAEVSRWEEFVDAVALILHPKPVTE